jgi:hypothetical protein
MLGFGFHCDCHLRQGEIVVFLFLVRLFGFTCWLDFILPITAYALSLKSPFITFCSFLRVHFTYSDGFSTTLFFLFNALESNYLFFLVDFKPFLPKKSYLIIN